MVHSLSFCRLSADVESMNDSGLPLQEDGDLPANAGDCVFPEGSCVQDCVEERCCPPKKRRATIGEGELLDVVTAPPHQAIN